MATKRKKDLSRFLYHAKHHLAFSEEEWLVEATLSTGNFWSAAAPVGVQSPILNRYLIIIASAVTPSEKVQLTPTGSPLCAVQ